MFRCCRRSAFSAMIASSALVVMLVAPVADACTRALYFGKQGQTVTGRTMDWSEDMHSNMWIFPRRLARDGGLARGSLKWTSKYGSVVTSVYEGASADGMNEKGFVANLLYLAESEYAVPGDKRPALVISSWAQYLLDNFATVAEAVADARKDTYRMVTVALPNGKKGNVHLAISDRSGDSAIFEYLDGKLVIHHGKQYQVMTNSPTYDQQLTLNAYWKEIGGTVMLPGTNRAADRFVRASFYIDACKQSANPREAVASVFSVMNNCSVPIGISTPNQPNIATTLWRTVADQKNRVYYFESTSSPSVLWVELADINFNYGSGTRKLLMDGNPDIGGNQTANFKKAEPFKFLAPE